MSITVDVTNVGELADDVSSGTTIALTTTSAVAAGSTIILTGSHVNNSGQVLSSVTDNGPGLSWSIDKQGKAQTNPSNSHAWVVSAYAPAGLASGTVITAHLSASTTGGQSMAATSFKGVKPLTPVGATATTDTNTTNAWTTGSVAIQAGSLLIAISTDWSALHTSTPTGPSVEAHDFGSGGFAVTTCYRIESAAGSYAVAGTWGATISGVVQAVAYLAVASYASQVLADAPVAYYRLDEVSGQPQDSSGNGNHTTTTVGTPTYGTQGAIRSDANDNAITFHAADYFQAPDNATLDLGDVFTIEAWVKRASGSIGSDGSHTILDKGPNSYKLMIAGGIEVEPTNSILLVKRTVGTCIASSVLITDTLWHHIVATKNGATAKLYVDGVEDTGATVTSQTFVSNAVDMRIGATTNGDDFMDGALDEVALDGTALSAARVAAHYNAAVLTRGPTDKIDVLRWL